MSSTSESMNRIEKFKNAFAKTSSQGERLLHFNNAGVTPMSLPARDALVSWADRGYKDGFHAVGPMFDESELTRGVLAKTIGAKPNEIAFFLSTAAAISQVALGLTLKPGDEIVILDQEYPSNFHPWRVAAERTGAVVRVAKSDPEDFGAPAEAIFAEVTARTRVIAFSWVQFRTGAIVDLARLTEFARAKNIFTCADIIQGAGLLPFDFASSGLDAACGGSHKWMVSPPSVGYLALREERMPEIKPITIGAMSYGGPDDTPTLASVMKSDSLKFEPGSRAFLDLIAFKASLNLINEVGIANIAQEVEWLGKKLMHGLRERGYKIHSPHGPHHRGSIVNFTPTADARYKTMPEIAERLTSIRASFALRAPGVRLAPHAFNTADDVETMLATL